MGNFRIFRSIFLAGLVVLFLASGVCAEDEILSGSDLLKAMREKKSGEEKPAYSSESGKSDKSALSDANNVESRAGKEIDVQEEAPAAKSVLKKTGKGDSLLRMIPAESLFCVRINNFDYTVGQLDQFLTGISPMPMGISMLARMQLANALGSSDLAGLNTGGNFAVFGTADSGEADTKNIFVAVIVGVTDYDQFITGNANIGPPDEKGVAKFMAGPLVTFAVIKTGDYAMITMGENYESMVKVAGAMSTQKEDGLAGVLGTSDVRAARNERIWLYLNPALAIESFGPAATVQLEQLKMMTGGMSAQDDSAGPTSPVMDMDFEQLLRGVQSFSLSISPKPEALKIKETISAIDGSEFAGMLTADSELMVGLMEAFDAKKPRDAGDSLKAISALIPKARRADFVGTYNLAEAFNTASAISPVPMPQITVETKSGVAYAARFYKNKLAVDAVLPKEHLTEIIVAVQAAQQNMMSQQSPMQAQTGMPMDNQPTMSQPTVIGIIHENENQTGTVTANYGDALFGSDIHYSPQLYLGRVEKGSEIKLLDTNVITNQFGIPIIKIKTLRDSPTVPANSIGWITLSNTSFTNSFDSRGERLNEEQN